MQSLHRVWPLTGDVCRTETLCILLHRVWPLTGDVCRTETLCILLHRVWPLTGDVCRTELDTLYFAPLSERVLWFFQLWAAGWLRLMALKILSRGCI
jgi:hypothetical protein